MRKPLIRTIFIFLPIRRFPARSSARHCSPNPATPGTVGDQHRYHHRTSTPCTACRRHETGSATGRVQPPANRVGRHPHPRSMLAIGWVDPQSGPPSRETPASLRTRRFRSAISALPAAPLLDNCPYTQQHDRAHNRYEQPHQDRQHPSDHSPVPSLTDPGRPR